MRPRQALRVGIGALGPANPGSEFWKVGTGLPDHPCLCLCLGLTQMTRTIPFRLMILHLLQIFFTDALTFMLYFPRYTILPRLRS